MFKRGMVVEHKSESWIGVVLQPEEGYYVAVKWFEGREGGGYVLIDAVMPIDGYAFEAALALGDTAKVLEMYRAAHIPDLYYVYRHDSYEPGDLEYYKPFETIDAAKQEIENGLKHEDMGIFVCRNNKLSALLIYESVWNADYTEYAYEWKPITAQPADGSATE